MERGEIAEAAAAQQLLPLGDGAAEIVRGVRVGAEGDDLAAETAVERQNLRVWQRRVAAIGVALDADALFDQDAENLLHLRHVRAEGDVLAAYLVDAAHRERQVPEHAEPSPLRERQHLREIRVNHMVIIRVVAVAVDIEEVGAAVLVAEHVYRADDKVQPRRGVGQMVGDGEIEIRLAQLHAEPAA